MKKDSEKLGASQVYCAQAPCSGYAVMPNADYPELPKSVTQTTALATLRSLFATAGLDNSHFGTPSWNPLADIIPNKKVVVKPNWVVHKNGSGRGLDCLVTHTTVLDAILQYVIMAAPERIVLGDAPIQGCDFGTLLNVSGVSAMIDRFSKNGHYIQLKDFRRTVRPDHRLATRPHEACRPLDEFILYDLGSASALDEITKPSTEFRVTMYNPDLLKSTHSAGKHQYLIARDVIESDVVINVPKLKTHKKACVTGALKNMVGMNGHKEYLPHHRKGNPQSGGDCYPQQSHLKNFVEDLLDATNRARGSFARMVLANAVLAGRGLGKILKIDNDYEGSWYGNDTVWRMTLDLQRILYYGRPDGTLADTPQRLVLTVTDAIVAGEGDGPLSPTPIGLGMITMGMNTAAVEWVNTVLMGLSPRQISLTRESFTPHPYPLADFSPEAISVFVNGQPIAAADLFAQYGRAFRLPKGWRKLVEPDSVITI